MTQRMYALMWDCYGLEAVQEVPDPSLATFAVLANQDRPVYPSILHWQLRARYNPQRHYEIYIISAEPDVSAADIRSAFESDPQGMVDIVRMRGQCFYSDRSNEDRIKIR